MLNKQKITAHLREAATTFWQITSPMLRPAKYWLIIDIILILLAANRYVIKYLELPYNGFFVSDFMSISGDWEMGEIYKYIKELTIVIIIFLLYKKRPSLTFISWGVLYGYVLLDDSMQIHERFGEIFEDIPDLIPSILSNQSLGELGASIIFGSIIFIGIFYGLFKSSPQDRIYTEIVIGLFGLLAFFSIGIDIFVSGFFSGYHARTIIHFIEDAGELFAITLTLLFMLGLKKAAEET